MSTTILFITTLMWIMYCISSKAQEGTNILRYNHQFQLSSSTPNTTSRVPEINKIYVNPPSPELSKEEEDALLDEMIAQSERNDSCFGLN